VAGAAPVRVGTGEAGYPRSFAALGDAAPASLTIVGEPTLLRLPLVALCCSARLPASCALASVDLARALRDTGAPVVGGFQSPTERTCLDFLLRGRQPVVICPARGLGGMRVPAPWRAAREKGRLVLVSGFSDRVRRPTSALSEARNRLVVALARAVVVIHATPGGRLARLAVEALRAGRRVYCLDLPENEDLRVAGAVARGAERLAREVAEMAGGPGEIA
jgi:predicted Rossmann fold nucleotide-binding protein DprA/Smf involved in DNA uptake